jgi:hypothetical protein
MVGEEEREGEGKRMDTMNEWEPALTKEECNGKELGACYCGECEGEGASNG